MGTLTVLLLDSSAADAELLEQLSLAVADAGFDVYFLSEIDDALRQVGDIAAEQPSSGVVLIGPSVFEPLATAGRIAHRAPDAEILILTALEGEHPLEHSIPAAGMHLSIARYNDPSFKETLRAAAERATARMSANRKSAEGDETNGAIISDHYLATILTHAQDAIISTDIDGNVLTWNHGARVLFVTPASDAVGHPIYDLALGEWKEQLPALMRIARHGGVIGARAMTILRIDGAWLDIEISGAPVRGDDGTQIGIAIIARDITSRKRGEQERLRLANHISLLLDSTGEGIFGTDRAGIVTFINRAAAEMFGYAPGELLGRNIHEMVHHHHADGSPYPEEDCPVTRTRLEGVVSRSENEIYWRRDGRGFPVARSSFPVIVDGQVEGAVVIFEDVTEEQAARDEIERRRAEIDVILQGIADGITAQDPSGRIIYANLAAAQLSGFDSVDAFLNTPVSEVVAKFAVLDEDAHPLAAGDYPGRRALGGERSAETVMRFRNLDTGEERWTTVKARPVFDHEGNVRFAINIFRDITHLKEAETRLRFLAEASEVLNSSLDYEITLASVAKLAVPKMADWAGIDMLTPDGSIQRLATEHVDPEKVQQALEFARRVPVDVNAATGVPNVIRTGKPAFYPFVTAEMIEASSDNEEVVALTKQLQLSSVMIVPLVVRGRTLGAITLIYAESGRRYTESDLALAEDLARRAGIAIDNAWLHKSAHEQSEWLRVTLSSIGDAVIATDPEGRITFMNPVAQRLTGYDGTDGYGLPLPDVFRIVNEETRATVENPVEKVIRTGFVVGLANHTVLIARDGTEIPIDDSAAPIRDGNGSMLGVVMVFHDITERRHAERERAELLERERQAREDAEANERQYRSMAEAMPQIVWTTDATGRADYYNRRWMEYTGLTLGESLTGGLPRELVHPDDIERTMERWKDALATGTVFEAENRLRRHSDGDYRWHLARTVPVRDAEGNIIKWIGTATDIDAQKRAEDRMQFLAEASEILASSLNYETTLASVVNIAVPKIGDWASADMLARDGSIQRLAVAHVDPAKVEWAHELWRRYPPDPNAPTGVPNVLRTGEPEFIPIITDEMLDAIPMTEEMRDIVDRIGFRSAMTVPVTVRGRTIGTISFVATTESGRLYTDWDLKLAQDLARRAGVAIENAELFATAQAEIAERTLAEADMLRAKEAAEAANIAKDQFLAVLSHELRTPLTPVLTLTQALKEEEMPEEIRSMIEIIDRNVELEARLIDDLLDLTRIEKGKLQLNLEIVDAHALIGNVMQIYRSDILGKGLRLALRLDAPEHFVRADPARLQQIFWNLVKNAVKFTPEGGDIMVRTFNDEEGHIVAQVIDNGIGIEPEILPQIFTAFEQGNRGITREFGGLGLGLAISNALVDMHGGHISAASEGRGRGATFTVELAVATPRGNGAATSAAPRQAMQGYGPKRILLVDDHEDTSKVMKLLLERRGYDVTTAATMQASLEAAMHERFDLMISDIGLPDGSGLDLMATLMRNGIPIKGIALSGFGMEEDIRRSKEVGFIEHLTKPISFQKLQDIIERLLGS